MQPIQAIGFDLFDTLITVQNLVLQEAVGRLIRCLHAQGLAVDGETFEPVYQEAARHHMQTARRQGRETHNRFWISTALNQLGHAIAPNDHRITQTVDAYFSAFIEHASLLPHTRETLVALRRRYRLGLLSNFTHGPAVRTILDRLGLTQLLDVILISGELGYRKPHPRVFVALQRHISLPKAQIAFIGDDPEADVRGAQEAGLQPIRTTYAQVYKATNRTDPEARSTPDTHPGVPTIASWTDLLTLLDM
ncbi:Phosphoglycolate phosphatase [Candidatus Entotheonellaceae bacterium PAL068K]